MTDQSKPREFWICITPGYFGAGDTSNKEYSAFEDKYLADDCWRSDKRYKNRSIHVREVMPDEVTVPRKDLDDTLEGDTELINRLDRMTRALEKAKHELTEIRDSECSMGHYGTRCCIEEIGTYSAAKNALEEIEAIERGEK